MILIQIVYIKSKCLFQLHGNQMAQTHKHVLNVKLPKINEKVEIRRNEQVETASNGFGFRFKYDFQIK